jgi:nucleoside-diphosphate-sugar epimerase
VISGEKVLVTGASGGVGEPLARFLAGENEVWGLARFLDAQRRADLEAAGITTCAADVASGDFDDVPDDFTYVLHLAWARGDLTQLHDVLRVNVEGTGLLLRHCRKAKAALVMSSTAIYSANADPHHAFVEDDPVGQTVLAGMRGSAATSPASKLGEESVARFCALAFELPVVITRLNTFTGIARSMPGFYIRSVLSDQPVVVPCDPYLHSPIDIADMQDQLEALLDAAATPALTVNWCGDDVIAAREWAALAASWAGKSEQVVVDEPAVGPKGNVSDPRRRREITGPCRLSAETSFRNLYDAMTTPR